MKLILAGSVAIIMALILFLPEVRQTQLPRAATKNQPPSVLDGQRAISEPPISISALSKKTAELTATIKQRSQEVQQQLRELLSEVPPKLEEADRRLQSRRQEVVLEKILLLGEEHSSDDNRDKSEVKLVLDALDNELKTLSEQEQLLNSLNRSKTRERL